MGAYRDLSEALADLSSDQIEVDVKAKKVTLTGLCEEGVKAVINHMVDELCWESSDLESAIPCLANVNKSDLISLIVGDDSADIHDLLTEAQNARPNTVAGRDKMSVGNKYSASREITEMSGNSLTYKDQKGRLHVVRTSSFKGWTKDKDRVD